MKCVFVICVLLHEAKPMDFPWLSLSGKLLSVGRVPNWVGCKCQSDGCGVIFFSSCLNVSVQHHPLKFKGEPFELAYCTLLGLEEGCVPPSTLPS